LDASERALVVYANQLFICNRNRSGTQPK